MIKCTIEKLSDPTGGEYRYTVREWATVDGELFYYCGNGRFCRTRSEAIRYKKQREAKA